MPTFFPGTNDELNDLVIAKRKDAKLDIDVGPKEDNPILWNVYDYDFTGYDEIIDFINQQDGSGQIYFNGKNLTEDAKREYKELLEEHDRERKAKYPYLNLPDGQDPF